jgi:hypothetical protein
VSPFGEEEGRSDAERKYQQAQDFLEQLIDAV